MLTLIKRNHPGKPDDAGPGLKRVYRVKTVVSAVLGCGTLCPGVPWASPLHGRYPFRGTLPQNAGLLAEIIEEFGFASLGIVAADLTASDQAIQLGVEPNRIDLMTSISGVSFDEAWDTRAHGEVDGVRLVLISKDLLRRNKTGVGRKQDLLDLDYL